MKLHKCFDEIDQTYLTKSMNCSYLKSYVTVTIKISLLQKKHRSNKPFKTTESQKAKKEDDPGHQEMLQLLEMWSNLCWSCPHPCWYLGWSLW